VKISIAINSYKNSELLRLCLGSVFRYAAGSGYEFEVLVADSETEEGTRLTLQDFPGTRFFSFDKNVGFVSLINMSLQEAMGDYIFLINHDIVLTEGAVEKLFRFMEAHADVGMAGSRQVNFNGTEQISCFRFYRPWTILFRRTLLGRLPIGKRHTNWFLMKDYNRKQPREVDWIMGSAMFVRRTAADSVGLMDTRFFMYMEDVDWCRRFWEKGWKVTHIPSVTIYHYHGKGSARGGFLRSLFMNRLTWYHIVSAVKYFRKYLGKPAPKHQ
jgi:GT2 family glycosyltransferase